MIRQFLGYNKNTYDISPKDAKAAFAYIEAYWPKLIHENKRDTQTLIGLPNPYVVPSTRHEKFNFEEQYYWDSFFICLGLKDQKYKNLAVGMVENLAELYERFGLIPNASRMYFTSRSQPPLLTTFINLVHTRFGTSDAWRSKMMRVAESEYNNVWMGQKHPHWRFVGGLNRYYDINGLHDLAEAESGWDMTPRFDRKCLDYYPIDLNALLYKYEKDFADFYEEEGDKQAAKAWLKRADARAKKVDEILWHATRHFYFDYNFMDGRHGSIWSLAAYYPLWAGMVSPERATTLVKHLSKFERDGGLTTTTKPLIDMSIFGSIKTQWGYPNGWAPLHWLVVRGLENYGFYDDAERIAKKWLKTNIDWFNKHGEFGEKYNVVSIGKPAQTGLYPSQSGFGWTNGVFVDLAKDYFDTQKPTAT